MYTAILGTISTLIKLDDTDLNPIENLAKPFTVNKGTILIDKGEVSNSAFFVNSGFLRYYKTNSAGEEITIHLFSPGDFAASFNSFVTNTKSNEILHTLTDSDLLIINKNDLEELYASGTKWQVFGRKLMEKFLLEKENRIIDQISLTAKERYIKLLQTKPDLIQNVPIQYLASFIGIKPESLSRIRKQIFLTNVN